MKKPIFIIVAILFVSCDLLTGGGSTGTTTTSVLSLSEAVGRIPRPADFAPEVLVSANAGLSSKALWSRDTDCHAIGFNTGRYLVNGGFDEFTAPFYCEVLAALERNTDKPQNTPIDLGSAELFDEQFEPGYTFTATWSSTLAGTTIRAAFQGESSGMPYLVRIAIDIVPETSITNSYKISSVVWLMLESGETTQNLHVFSEYRESDNAVSIFLHLTGYGDAYQYAQYKNFTDGSIGFGMNTVSADDEGNPDEALRFYSYGYSDYRGAILNSDNGPTEYLDDKGEYDSDLARLDKYTYPPEWNLGIDTSDGADPCLWIDTDSNGTFSDDETKIPAHIENFRNSEYMQAGYFITTGIMLPILDIPADDPLWNSFTRKPGGTYYRTQLNSKITGKNNIKSQFQLDYSLADYEARIAEVDALVYPGI